MTSILVAVCLAVASVASAQPLNRSGGLMRVDSERVSICRCA